MRHSRPHRSARPLPTRLVGLLAALLAALFATLTAACDSAPDEPDATPPPQVQHREIPSDATYNGPDVIFAQEARRLLAQAVEMATLAETRASAPAVKQLAAKAKKDREAAVDILEQWLIQAEQPVPSALPTEGQRSGRTGLASADEMKELEGVSGEPFDRLFLRMLIVNNQASVNVLNAQQWSGKTPPLMDIAHRLAEAQKVELTEARRLLGR
ncbi:MAG TPA: DUF305 domain-containing protein [Micromonosporaceae bacterium]|nr:DUF305 domain-containing protein [Micromonosporaceae bacterium]